MHTPRGGGSKTPQVCESGPVPRCVVTTQNPRTGEKDFDTLAALHRLRGENSRKLSTPTAHLPDGGRLVLGV